MPSKEVKVKVGTDVEDSKVKALEEEIQRLKLQRLQLNIDANTAKIAEIQEKIEGIDLLLEAGVDLDDEELDKLAAEMESLQSQKLALEISVADDELTKAKAEEEELNTTAQVDIDVDESAIQGAMQNINDGINQTKQGLSDLAGAFSEVQQAGMQSEQNQAFLTMNLGADKAKQTYQDISDIVASMPGDDNTMRSVLSTAQALGNNLKPEEMKAATATMADYMGGSATMGKQALESQQDIMKYLLDGNTAELERGSIVSSQVDKLKDANTFMERQAAMQEVLNDLGYGGIANQDTMLNKQAEWEGMLYNAKDTLSSMWLDAEKGAMDFFLGLNDATGGLAGMGMVLATQLGPGIFSTLQGVTTMAPGIMQLTEKFGGFSGMLSAGTGAITGFGSTLLSIATGPVGIAVAAIALLAIGIYEAGKAFGWWSDVGSMLDAIKTGVMELWNAFISNPYVIQVIDLIKQGLTDAWNAIVGFGQAIMSALGGAGGQFDILSWAINGLQIVLNTVGPLVVLAIQGMIQHFRNIYTVAQIVWPYISSAISTAIGIATGIVNAGKGVFQSLAGVWNGLSSTVSSMASTIHGALSSAGSAWNSFKSTVMNAVQPILDAANQVGDAIGQIASVIGMGGIETPTINSPVGGYTPIVTSGNPRTVIFNMYGDIKDEKTLDDTIDAINNRIEFEKMDLGDDTE